MARYTIHVPQSEMAMGLESPLNAIEAYYKVRELREMGFKIVSLRNVDTDEEIVDIESLIRDSLAPEPPERGSHPSVRNGW